jgi:hypothetical protein
MAEGRDYDEYEEDFRTDRGPRGGGYARERVNAPATGLLVTGILGIVAQIAGLVYNLAIAPQLEAAVRRQTGGGRPGMPAGNEQLMALITGPIAIISAALGIAIAVLILVGATRMKNLQSYGLVMAASILAMVPCVSPCCLVGLPIGIWALTVLNDPEVKAAFRG